MTEQEKLRIDKYLWAIRLFKTRSLATEACKAGRVKLKGQNLKPSAIVKVGEVYQVSKGIEKKVIEVVELLYNRVESKIAVTKYNDITPEEETYAFNLYFMRLHLNAIGVLEDRRKRTGVRLTILSAI